MTQDEAEFEAEVAVLTAKLQSSSLLKQAKEPFDATHNMMPLAYAMFLTLAHAGVGSGCEHEWFAFLEEALKESIADAERKSLQ